MFTGNDNKEEQAKQLAFHFPGLCNVVGGVRVISQEKTANHVKSIKLDVCLNFNPLCFI